MLQMRRTGHLSQECRSNTVSIAVPPTRRSANLGLHPLNPPLLCFHQTVVVNTEAASTDVADGYAVVVIKKMVGGEGQG